MTTYDLKQLDSEALNLLSQRVQAEVRRRRALKDNEQQIDHLLDESRTAEGIELGKGEPWVRPSHALNAYPRGAIVTHNGKKWQSTTPVNVWPPGQSGWRELPTQEEETGEETVPEYQQPTGAHDAYQTGEQVLWEDGEIYESVIDGNVWTPADYPQGWKRIED